jgi:DNA-binding NtrC family response regulator
VERAVIMCNDNGILEPEHLGLAINLGNQPAAVGGAGAMSAAGFPGGDEKFPTLAELEKHHIFAALDRCKGNRTHAAKMLDVSIRTLRNKLHEYNGTSPKGGEESDLAEA